ncbi:ABC transporter permease subunit [Candidatus Liberibacter africanus]|uniref:Proline/glycine betaine ABC transporter permease protein n=1 Tax=Candidatus Liberibacter africanus PTSAPSY TaxID=1277257 RepID=A0A0G3I229_LIBAF|nr:ABC transporter permease subunit [Candidatus Liberibacter africanus]AKK19906.1 proline/glycine betaine ABC transporter permease protein [Candidatus Liberibacter africanus PTSAPSY]QTP63755.1 ABC transporter permease subunit [Candidatus Liberibacter africanus]
MNRIIQARIPLGDYLQELFLYFTNSGEWFFNTLSFCLLNIVNFVLCVLQYFSPLVSVGVVSLLVLMIKRSITIAIGTAIGLLLIINQGYWQETTETLSLVLVSTVISMLIGIPIGVLAAWYPRFYSIIRLLLDSMQTIPTFVYLIPALVLFGLGMVPGIISTIVFSIPIPVRFTRLGIISTPPILKEAARAFGATPLQIFRKVEFPFAIPQIVAGLTQTIMLSLSMVVVTALVGSNGLGVPVLRALNTVDISKGFESGLCIVILAIILDRWFSIPDQRDMT